MKVYSPKDRFKVSIEADGLAFLLAPLTVKQKGEILSLTKNRGGSSVHDQWEMVRLALRYGVKGVEGVTDSKGEPFVPQFDAEGGLTDESMDVIYEIGNSRDALIVAALQVHKCNDVGQKMDAVYNDGGQPIEGVSLVHAGKV